MLRELVAVQADVLGPDHVDTLDSEMMVALTLYPQKRMEESRNAYAAVLPRIGSALGDGAASYLVGTANYAGLLYPLGDYDMAERTLRECLRGHQQVYGDRYYGTYYTMSELGTTLVHKQQFDEAETLLTASFNGFRDIYAAQPSHHRVQQGLDRPDEALYCLEQATKGRRLYQALLIKAKKAAARAKPQ